MSSLPKISIEHGRLLEPYFEPYAKQAGFVVPPVENIKQILADFSKEWSKSETDILEAICNITGFTYSQDEITVYIVRNLRGGMSNPMIISAAPSPDRFVDLLTHELLHRIFSKNKDNINIYDRLKELFPDYDPKTTIHIGVHAVLAFLYRNVLNDESRLERDIAISQKSEPYRLSWEVVETVGYRNILEKIFKKK